MIDIVNFIKGKKEFIKFGIVGVSNTLITFVVYNILLKLGINYLVANIIGYICGMINGFIWSKNWVFRVSKESKMYFIKFALVNLLSLAVSTGLLMVLVKKLSFNSTIAQLITTCITVVINYLLNKIYTFKV
ncbi:GtrA family protein [Clostridium intestinale]|uniref:GtrA family protein n=1 Tax=Clostridium intestinale URNW TaxID=1294142 RepID=U2PZS2_9CLOT|nr:GtrA family protein [Clostridium intestinale]ERK32010.1 GtrA family protein [Clostridium intestinale URNW]